MCPRFESLISSELPKCCLKSYQGRCVFFSSHLAMPSHALSLPLQWNPVEVGKGLHSSSVVDVFWMLNEVKRHSKHTADVNACCCCVAM